jgi:hypothetical protein
VLAAARHRLHQGLAALRPVPPQHRDAILSRVLTDRQADAFCRLPHYDQAHLSRIYELLRSSGARDHDLLAASLLHDLGKVDEMGTVRLPHRVSRVLLSRFAPRVLAWLARLPARRWRAGFALAVHHPALGAERARQLGCSDRTCWLIAHHEDDPPPDDEQLRRLIAADRAA